MGNTRSDISESQHVDVWWNNKTESNINSRLSNALKQHDNVEVVKELGNNNEEKLIDFKQVLIEQKEKRRKILAEKKLEIQQLREDLLQQQNKNKYLEHIIKQNKSLPTYCEDNILDNNVSKVFFVIKLNQENFLEIERLKSENERLKEAHNKLSAELAQNKNCLQNNIELRESIAEIQMSLDSVSANVEKEREEYQTHVLALKEVIKVLKRMIQIREHQLLELRQKVVDIEASLADRNFNVLSDDLKNEYERQLNNIRNLKLLYEERQQADKRAKTELASQLDTTKKDLQKLKDLNSELDDRLQELETNNSDKYDKINSLESNLGFAKAECRELQAEMSVINQLFAQILLSFNNCQEIDLDKLIRLLEDNHDLLQNIIINEDCNEISTVLPKALLDLVIQVDSNQEADKKTFQTILEESEEPSSTALHHLNSAEEIAENLPKVWKVLIELLSHQTAPTNIIEEDAQNPCYIQVHTPNGPRLALSISKTFIRLKDLILEKKNLEKETNHLKYLNTHLETHLQDQEKRLEIVSNELTKTWHIVGKMQKQHQQLHTQEKILRYELAQKRKLLTELKEELEFCREKWIQAREKNSSTEEQWKQLRNEFASRKITTVPDLNNSTESGYSDDRECSSDEERNHKTSLPKSHEENTSKESSSILKVIQQEVAEIENFKENSDKCITEQSINKVQIECEGQPTTALLQSNSVNNENSNKCTIQNKPGTSSEYFENSAENVVNVHFSKEERLRNLEEQTKQLVIKVMQTTNKSAAICTKLDKLHEQYGGEDLEATENCTDNEDACEDDVI